MFALAIAKLFCYYFIPVAQTSSLQTKQAGCLRYNTFAGVKMKMFFNRRLSAT